MKAVMFDLLTGLLDSWSLWDDVAGSREDGRSWRGRYLERTYGQGAYRPYEELVALAAGDAGLDPALAERLAARWDELEPWPEAPSVLAELARDHALAVVTNCSDALGRRAAARLGVAFDIVVTAEQAGFYKPHPVPYERALAELELPAAQVLFLAGSPGDVGGAGRVGMPVVWHNRAALPPGDVAPFAEIRDLRRLPELLARLTAG